MLGSCRDIAGVEGGVVVVFSLGGRDVPDGAKEAVIVEPMDLVPKDHEFHISGLSAHA